MIASIDTYMDKLEYRRCPECGEVYTNKKVKKILLGRIDVDLSCANNHSWTEHFTMTYDGFSYNGVRYDRYGDKCEENENEEERKESV
jgi:hypothetical protein